ERDLLEAHVLAEHLRDDLGHVVVRQILGSEQRDLAGIAPACVEQQPRGRGGDVAGGDGRPLAIASERVAKPAWAAQGVPRPSMETPTTRPTPCLWNASAAGRVKPAKAASTDG